MTQISPPYRSRTIEEWHYHLQVGGVRGSVYISDVVYFDVNTLLSDFMKIARSFDGPDNEFLNDPQYEADAVAQMELHTEAGEGLGIYFDSGNLRVKVSNCESCYGSSLN